MSLRRIAAADRAMGVIVPSSNRVVERVTQEILASVRDVDACFARIAYYGNAQGQPGDRYDEEPFLQAAELLSHAAVDVICWNGTRGAALGFAPDRALCEKIAARTGIPAVTTALAALDAFAHLGASRMALVTHGLPDGGAVTKAAFAAQGIETAAELHLGFTDNLAVARADPAPMIRFAREAGAHGGIDAVLIWSTNIPGHGFAGKLEAEIGIPVLDSAAIGVWAALRALGSTMPSSAGLGRLFA